ncbi:MAG: AzlD domain-containing protein [Lachnospiraceae bacterium]|nr:AzlD domain-containing protein [Lachnospiraceae bacterium]
MNNLNFLYIAIMGLAIYLVRMLPLVLLRREIKNVYLRSFLSYVPYVTLAAMTFPAIITATGNIISGIVGLVCAAIIAYVDGNLFKVSVGACLAVFVTEFIMGLL